MFKYCRRCVGIRQFRKIQWKQRMAKKLVGRKLVGHVGVDSGLIFITDPVYATFDEDGSVTKIEVVFD